MSSLYCVIIWVRLVPERTAVGEVLTFWQPEQKSSSVCQLKMFKSGLLKVIGQLWYDMIWYMIYDMILLGTI